MTDAQLELGAEPAQAPQIIPCSIPKPEPATPSCAACSAPPGASCAGDCESRTIGRGGNRSADYAPPRPAS